MNDRELEPGFLRAFRFFIAIRIVFWVVIGPILVVLNVAQDPGVPLTEIADLTLIERLTLPNILPILGMEAVLLLFTLPRVSRSLGRRFVPLMLVMALIPLLVGQYWWPAENPLQTPFVIFFFVMLVFIAWQYSFRYVLAYVVALTLYQARFTRLLEGLPVSFNLGWLVLQAAMMLIVGYIIVQLVSIHREQRAALAEAYERQAAAHRRLQQYTAMVEELTISRERNRLARELHDTLAHSLSAAAVQLEAFRAVWQANGVQAHRLLDQTDETIRRGLVEARRAMQQLRALPLDQQGLTEAMRQLAEAAAERSGAGLELHLPSSLDGQAAPGAEQGLYRVAQEALENIVRHADARHIVLRLEAVDNSLILTVRDDGQGIAGEGEEEPPGDGDRLGILGMRERAGMVGGQLEIQSQPGKGTTVRLAVPLGSGGSDEALSGGEGREEWSAS
ncbi:MAG TPA: sensor histidine kinase [Anaerolineae bacterium]|nr:sensor histidine kinase [Anaerolineae bacterium]